MTDSRSTDRSAGIPEARRRRTRWPGWVWLIPLVAMGFAGWLAFEEWVVGPRSLTVSFESVEGIKPGAPVRYRGVQVGSVERIELEDDLGGARLVLDMTALAGRLGEGTRVWIERPRLSPGQLGSLISGPYIAIAPAGTGEVETLAGLATPPILEPEEPGRVLVLTDDEAEGLAAGAPVRFRGIEVGRVLGTRFAEDGTIEIPVFVRDGYAGLLREATVFWRAGGLAVDSGAGGLAVDLPSLGSLATGAVAFDTPEVLAGQEAGQGSRFPLWRSRDAAATARSGPRLAYSILFADPVGDLAQGAPVTLAGKQVGRVAGTDLEVAPGGDGLVTPVTVVIDARRMGLDLAAIQTREALRQELDTIFERLAGIGMRARVAEGAIVFGARSIELVVDPEAGPAPLDRSGDLPRLPAAGRAGAQPAGQGGGQAPADGEQGAAETPTGDGQGAAEPEGAGADQGAAPPAPGQQAPGGAEEQDAAAAAEQGEPEPASR